MERIAPICDARFSQLCSEPRAAELLALGTHPNCSSREGVGGNAARLNSKRRQTQRHRRRAEIYIERERGRERGRERRGVGEPRRDR